MSSKILLSAVIALGLFSSCSKDKNTTDPVTPGVTGNVTMRFENYAGNTPLNLNNTQGYAYTNSNGEQLNISMYKYYVSNVRYIKSDGSEYAVPESYYLINQAEPSSLNFSIAGLPAGNYTSIKVLLGVDSARNNSGAQTGALDPLYGMFWAWSSGYIMAKIEGDFLNIPTGNKKVFSFHLGGYTGKFSVLHEVILPLPQNLVVGDNTTSAITLKSDALKWFDAFTPVKLAELSEVGSAGADAHELSVNFSYSLSVTGVEN